MIWVYSPLAAPGAGAQSKVPGSVAVLFYNMTYGATLYLGGECTREIYSIQVAIVSKRRILWLSLCGGSPQLAGVSRA